MATPGSDHIRSTQRVPRSCTRCARRKVRCNKEVPCGECISRNCAESCQREVVKVKGFITEAEDGPKASYDDLLEENRRLRSLVTRRAHNDNNGRKDGGVSQVANVTQVFENRVFDAVRNIHGGSSVASETDVLFPSENCSKAVLDYGFRWISWIHCSVFEPEFALEHTAYFAKLQQPFSPPTEPLWFAIYFAYLSASLLFMDDAEAQCLDLPHDDVQFLLRNWYDSAVFFLYKADFLRDYQIRTVQTISILALVFVNVGDYDLFNTLLSCAIRIAQSLKLDSDDDNRDQGALQAEVRRRLWWNLVICEWLGARYRPPCLSASDFDVPYPAPLDDDDLMPLEASPGFDKHRPRPIEYSIVMAKVATVYYRFRESMTIVKSNDEDIAVIIQEADNHLASIISNLPSHLQEYEEPSRKNAERDLRYPWIQWQRKTITAVLLYYRIIVNRVMQPSWINNISNHGRARAICLGSARAIVNVVRTNTDPFSRSRTWTKAIQVFSAAVTLLFEAQNSEIGGTSESFLDEVDVCVIFLNGIQSQNLLARYALSVLLELLGK